MRTATTVALLAIAAAGGLQVYGLRGELAPLRAEYDRLSAKYADFEVTEPQKYYVAAVETGDPMAFAWRFYEPPNGSYLSRLSIGNKDIKGASWGEPNGSHAIMRLAFEPIEDGFRYFWKQRRLGGHQGELWTGPLGNFLKRHWSELRFTVLADGETRSLHRDAVVTLLTVEVPPELRDELRAAVGELEADKVLPRPVLELSFGSATSMENQGLERHR